MVCRNGLRHDHFYFISHNTNFMPTKDVVFIEIHAYWVCTDTLDISFQSSVLRSMIGLATESRMEMLT